MPRRRVTSRIAFVCAAALAAAVGGCSSGSSLFDSKGGESWFSKPTDIFATPDWAKPVATKGGDLGPKGPVGPEDLVSADGSCPPPAGTAQAAAQPAPADRPVGSPAGDLAGSPMPAAAPGQGFQSGLEPGAGASPPVLGGIALGMTECQAVRRAGLPATVAISANEKGERKVVLTYLSGPWPGIYTFASGRLKVIDRAPEPPKPVKPAPKKKSAKPRTASQGR